MSAFGHVTATVQRRHPASLALVGLPLLAGVGVTVLVLTRGPGDAAKAPPPSPGGGA